MQPAILEFLPAEVHSLILSHVPDVPTLLALVQASHQSHKVYRLFQRAVLESVVKNQTPHYILSAMLCVKAFASTTARDLTPIFIADEYNKFQERIKTQSEFALTLEESKWLVNRNNLVEQFISQFATSKIHQLENFLRKQELKSTGESGSLTNDSSRYGLSTVEHYRLRRAFVHMDFIGCLLSLPGSQEDTEDTEDMDYIGDKEDDVSNISASILGTFRNQLKGLEHAGFELRCAIQHVWQTLNACRSKPSCSRMWIRPLNYTLGATFGIATLQDDIGGSLQGGLPRLRYTLASDLTEIALITIEARKRCWHVFEPFLKDVLRYSKSLPSSLTDLRGNKLLGPDMMISLY